MNDWEESSSGPGRSRKRHSLEPWVEDSSDEGSEPGDHDDVDSSSDNASVDGFGVYDPDSDNEGGFELEPLDLFVQFVTGLLLMRVINCKQFCVMMY